MSLFAEKQFFNALCDSYQYETFSINCFIYFLTSFKQNFTFNQLLLLKETEKAFLHQLKEAVTFLLIRTDISKLNRTSMLSVTRTENVPFANMIKESTALQQIII